ncbi:hypothetical protein B0E53_06731 [Micromonospora sp. MH33]|nr:hypothetical protein B0E53_06731 [Micromonospora sp. MH33]
MPPRSNGSTSGAPTGPAEEPCAAYGSGPSTSIAQAPSRSRSVTLRATPSSTSAGSAEALIRWPTPRTTPSGSTASPWISRSTPRCTRDRAGWVPAATSAVTSTPGTAGDDGSSPSSRLTPTTYAATRRNVSRNQTRVRRTAISIPHSRCRSTTASTAAGKNACEASIAVGASQSGTWRAHPAGKPSGAKLTASSRVPTASQPSPTRSAGGPVRHRRSTPAAATSPSSGTTRNSHGSPATTNSAQRGAVTGNGAPEGCPGRPGQVRWNSAIPAVTRAPAATATRAGTGSRPSRTSQGTTVMSESIPGTQAQSRAEVSSTGAGRSGRTASRSTYCALSADSPPPSPVAASSQATGWARRSRASQATVP